MGIGGHNKEVDISAWDYERGISTIFHRPWKEVLSCVGVGRTWSF
jgi:hypothetical protein